MRGFFPVKQSLRKNYTEVEILPELGIGGRDYPDLMLPTRADSGSAGYDFYSPINAIINPGEVLLVWSDVKACMLPDEVLQIHARSSLGVKHGIVLANGTGIIDSSYFNNADNDGNIGIPLKNTSNVPYTVNKGDKVAQGIFIKYLTTTDDVVIGTERGGGFGSSGK